MYFQHVLLIIAVSMSVWMLGLWVVQQVKKDATLVDAGWALGLTVITFFLVQAGPGPWSRKLLLLLIAGSWSVRLGGYLLQSRVFGRTQEDARYQRMRSALGRYAAVGFLLFFQMQALFALIFAVPLVAVAFNPAPLGLSDFLAVGVAIIAIGGEAMADAQLARWRFNPVNRTRTCTTGLWRYSRHPNYFFEWLGWFSYVLLCAQPPYALLPLTLVGPVAMLVFLFFITGIPHTEQQALSHRPDYAEYQRTTSAFFPWPPKR